MPLEPGAEITLEANPGTVEAARFRGFRDAGVNRISLGVQSFDDRMLTALGRIHSAEEARRGVEAALASFDNVNLDLMYGLPEQMMAMAQADIRAALACGVPHVSAYQLTIEPNTAFYSRPPQLPEHDACADMQIAIEEALGAAGYEHYETSAFARPGHRCRHNLNYWEFGDYVGIGAGAHGKLSLPGRITRHSRIKQPREYLLSQDSLIEDREVPANEIPFEFMLNALRLVEGFPTTLFAERTGLALATVEAKLAKAENQGLIERDWKRIRPSARGRMRFQSRSIRPWFSAFASFASTVASAKPVRSANKVVGKPSTSRSALSMNSKGISFAGTSRSSIRESCESRYSLGCLMRECRVMRPGRLSLPCAPAPMPT